MKSIITLGLLLGATNVFADSAKFSVSPFKGELISSVPVKVESVTVSARIQHCNFWGTTCAGGPSEVSQEPLTFRNDTSANLVAFELKKAIKLKSSKVGNRFSSCNLNITIIASNDKGEKFEGHIGLIHENDKSKCESTEEIKNQIAEKLKIPVKVNFWRSSR